MSFLIIVKVTRHSSFITVIIIVTMNWAQSPHPFVSLSKPVLGLTCVLSDDDVHFTHCPVSSSSSGARGWVLNQPFLSSACSPLPGYKRDQRGRIDMLRTSYAHSTTTNITSTTAITIQHNAFIRIWVYIIIITNHEERISEADLIGPFLLNDAPHLIWSGWVYDGHPKVRLRLSLFQATI